MYDVIIIGAGPTGSTAAKILSEKCKMPAYTQEHTTKERERKMKIYRKHILYILLSLCITGSCLTAPAVLAEAEKPITVFVDGTQVLFDVEPVTENDRTLVPMRFIFEALGASVTWNDATSTATAVKGEDTIQIVVDNTVMLKNGRKITLDVPARLVRDRTLVPVRAVSEGMGARVNWNETLRQIVIATPGKEHPYSELTDEDMNTLKASYSNQIRYVFEQTALPQAVLSEKEDLIKEIHLKSSAAKQFAAEVWNRVVISNIIRIQINSKEAYLLDESSTEDELLEGYRNLVQKAGLEAKDYFDVTFETLKNNSTMMTLTFQSTDTLLACKYIGIAVKADNSVRYFTAETDPMDMDNLYLCEITAENRKTLGSIKFEKTDFINAVNEILE